ncbi:HDOD domain-containing protein [Janthinobacterium sp. NKUCC06_STL]|uniref:HDOD domain-containing protein n=1 Tax=Janthinobacterium sp. NKUCC06_STL TaxID=2842127 RepID=UPI001C5AE8A3|nr:HDOD domain-containing protein [Janthinobacterium sp. NKUCC06_STL]MBW3509187.1 HDOD domain-containing protein [Janthinobacterium sp. NKUCC06_STL]
MSAHIDLARLLGGAILPSPAGRRHWLATLCQQQVPLDELAEQLGCDPALSGKVIGLANAGVPAGGRRHAAVSAAMLAAIGLPALHQAFTTPAPPADTCAHFDAQHYWSHALAMACAARVAGDALQLAPADALYSCGLLANCGQLALAMLHPQEYGELLGQHGNAATARLLCEESRRFGHHRLALSAILMRDWGMPDILCDAVRCHAAPPGFGRAGRMTDLAWLLKLASSFADLILRNGAGSRGPALAAARVLGLGEEHMETLLRHSNAEWSEWRDILEPHTRLAPSRTRTRVRPAVQVFSEFI